MLEWLEKPTVPRSSLERMIGAVIGTALRTGLCLDIDPLPAEITAMLDRYDEFLAASRKPAG